MYSVVPYTVDTTELTVKYQAININHNIQNNVQQYIYQRNLNFKTGNTEQGFFDTLN